MYKELAMVADKLMEAHQWTYCLQWSHLGRACSRVYSSWIQKQTIFVKIWLFLTFVIKMSYLCPKCSYLQTESIVTRPRSAEPTQPPPKHVRVRLWGRVCTVHVVDIDIIPHSLFTWDGTVQHSFSLYCKGSNNYDQGDCGIMLA